MRNNKSRNIKEYTHSQKYVGARVTHTRTQLCVHSANRLQQQCV